MADAQRTGVGERDIEQVITALKKGAYLLKYGRRGKPKFCPFKLSNDESKLIWYSGKEEKHVKLNQVSRIIPGQRTAIFQRYPRPEKEYQSFSLIYGDRSLDLICKDKDEAEVWLVGLRALISRGNYSRKWRIETKSESASSGSPRTQIPTVTPFDPGPGDVQGLYASSENVAQSRWGKAFSDIIQYTSAARTSTETEVSSVGSLTALNAGCVDNSNGRTSTSDAVRVSLSSAVSSSSQGSFHEDFDALGDIFIWGEGTRDGILGGGSHRAEDPSGFNLDASLPKALDSTVFLDVQNIAFGSRHALLVNRQGEIFSWGEESGGRLGHGCDADVAHPKLIETLTGMNIELVACGEHHTCAVTLHGDLYTWGDGIHNSGVLGHGSEASHWIPKRVGGDMGNLRVSYISCGSWHTAIVTSSGRLFTFGDGSFGVLGHGDHSSSSIPREVEALRGLRTTKVACGVWHTAAVVEMTCELSSPEDADSTLCGRLFTWGHGDNGCLGHGDSDPRLHPECVDELLDTSICQVACGNNLTVALTTGGKVYTMGSTAYGQLGSPKAKGEVPHLVGGKLGNDFVEEIACGSHHIAVLTSNGEVYTWGKGTNGQLGHGDCKNRNTPTLVGFLKDRRVKTVVCGANFTGIISLHKWLPGADHSVCYGCRNPFNFRRKRHNCYNCGLVFCSACSSRKSLRASLAPNMNKPHRVCDECFNKLKKAAESNQAVRAPKVRFGDGNKASEAADKELVGPKLQAQPSKLSSAEPIRAESWHYRRLRTNETNNRIFPAVDGKLQLTSFNLSKMSSIQNRSTKRVLTSTSSFSRLISSVKSPAPSGAVPPSPSEVTSDDSKLVIENLKQEIAALRTQVEEVTYRSHHLEAELERKSQQLEEVTAGAADEAEKCKSAKEVIKSLTAQLKEMAERQTEKSDSQSTTSGDHHSVQPSGSQNASSAAHQMVQNCDSQSTLCSGSNSMLSRDVESNGKLADRQSLPNGSKSQTEKPQRVIQAEVGVYITISPLPGGLNELKRVRFSRKHFNEQQAEKWWADNGVKVIERHNIQVTT